MSWAENWPRAWKWKLIWTKKALWQHAFPVSCVTSHHSSWRQFSLERIFLGWNDPAWGSRGWTGVMRVGAISFLPSGASQQELRLTHQCNTPHPHHPFIIAPTFYFTSISCRSFIDVFLSTLFRWPDTPPQVNLHMFSKLSLNCHSTFWSSTTAAWIGDNLFVTSQVHVTFIL